MAEFRAAVYFPSSPMKAIQSAAGKAAVLYDNGDFPADAAALAARADVALVFVTRHEMEGYDVPNLKLPNGQDELVEAVAAANPHTVVVLETGNPVAMPWLNRVSAVIAAWYPGQEGGTALANILFGKVNPSGRLPMSFLIDEAQAVRPRLPNHGSEPDAQVTIDYGEGSDIGYRWYGAHKVKLAFPFGHGLSYTRFQYSNLKIGSGAIPSVSLDVENVGSRAGADVPQIYLTSLAGAVCERLIAFQRVELRPGEKRTVTFAVDLRLLAHFNAPAERFVVPPGRYQISAGHSSQDLELHGSFLMRRTTI
jgi:beta-glucosidase